MLGNHLLGIYEKAFDPADTWPVRLQKAKNLGFDYMEISIDEQDSRIERLYWSRKQRLELYTQCFDAELPLKSMCLSAHRRFPLGSSSGALRSKARDIMKRALEFSCDLGIRVIQLAGYDVYYEPSTEESVKRFAEGMAWAAEEAAKYQVMLGMEIMDTPFMSSITKHLTYEKQIASPWYRVYPDLGNLSAWPENDPREELKRGAHSIVAVHLKDTKAVTEQCPGVFKGVAFGTGCVNFAQRLAQLEAQGYTGPYMMEMWYHEGQDDKSEIARSKEFIEEQFHCAFEG